jgi:Transposase domain (DUF772)
VSMHLGYRWFLGYDFDVPTPNHSVLSKARARFGTAVFEEFFRQSIELCGRAGLLEEGPVYVDSTLIRAGASMDSLTSRQDLIKPPLSITEYLRRLDEESNAPVAEPPRDSGDGLSPSGGSRRLPPNQALASRTDPEATLVDRPNFGRHLAYKAHWAAGGRNGEVITSAVATHRSGSGRAPPGRSALAAPSPQRSRHSGGGSGRQIRDELQLPLPGPAGNPGLHSPHAFRGHA